MHKFKLWMVFVFTVTITMATSFSLTGFLAFKMFQPNFIPGIPPRGWMAFISFAITAILISISLILFISRRFFLPIQHMNEALQKVAAGDFQVMLPEDNKHFEMQEMNVNFNKMVKELNSMEMLQSDFIQNVSHEFKTPLSSIEGYATLLHAASLSEELHGYTQRILESTKQLSSLTGNILKLSKLENQQIVSEKTCFSLDEQIRQAILSLEPLWYYKKLDIDIILVEVTYYGNEYLIYQVWTNLLSNAIKFTPNGGSIRITTEEKEDYILVKIRDSGIGITEEALPHIFDKFYQEDLNRKMEGNGLGLALVKKIIDLCSGEIEVTSRPDYGTCFSIWLPVSQKDIKKS